MQTFLISAIVMILTFVTATFFHPTTASAFEISKEEVPTTQATSTVPVEDDRTAALWEIDPREGNLQQSFATRECTAGYIGEGLTPV